MGDLLARPPSGDAYAGHRSGLDVSVLEGLVRLRADLPAPAPVFTAALRERLTARDNAGMPTRA